MSLYELYNIWFDNQHYWFSTDFDEYLSTFFDLTDNLISNFTKIDNIATIILYDQIARHYFRNTQSHHILTYFSYKASLISQKILHKYTFNDNELFFLYLPYRHIFHFEMIDKIINIYTQKYLQSSQKFYKKIINSTISKSIYMRNRFSILTQDNNIDNMLFHSILEYNPIIPIKQSTDPFFLDSITSKYKNNSPIIVSLSGGVDSNVLLHVCSFLKIPVIALHINYNNRNTCSLEENFLKYYCKKLNIPLYIRKITELNRNICHKNGLRDIYEALTKKIRFKMYLQLQEIYGKCYVALGHNLDDCFENIITNISKNQKYENLHGMNSFSTIDNIEFFRPFLNIPKAKIIEYAYKYGIPFLEDSTPSWSMRGKIRDIIRPAFDELDLIPSFIQLSNNISSIVNIIEEIVLPLFETNEVSNIPYDEYFWKQFFYRKNVKVSNKCMKEFIMYLKRFSKNKPCFVMNKKYIFQISEVI